MLVEKNAPQRLIILDKLVIFLASERKVDDRRYVGYLLGEQIPEFRREKVHIEDDTMKMNREEKTQDASMVLDKRAVQLEVICPIMAIG